jgi:hypothetical protein
MKDKGEIEVKRVKLNAKLAKMKTTRAHEIKFGISQESKRGERFCFCFFIDVYPCFFVYFIILSLFLVSYLCLPYSLTFSSLFFFKLSLKWHQTIFCLFFSGGGGVGCYVTKKHPGFWRSLLHLLLGVLQKLK